jgi:hypothetical protein
MFLSEMEPRPIFSLFSLVLRKKKAYEIALLSLFVSLYVYSSVSVYPAPIFYGYEAYEITLLSV